MAGWEDLFGVSSVAEQLLVWGVLNQLLGDLLGPFQDVISQKVNAANPEIPLTPADAAAAVVRNFLDQAAAEAEALKSGVNADRLETLIHLSGDAPGPQQLAEALRRQVIPEDGTGPLSTSFVQGIAEGRLADKWAPVIKALAVIWPTPTDALEAVLQGQVDEATGRTLYQRFGGDPDYYSLLFNTRGNAPTPMEALEMLNRKIIPESGTGPDSVSYEQAFLEGPWRNKWLGPFKALRWYVPPPRTVVALLRTGAITDTEAAGFFQAAGLDPALAAKYVHSAKGEKLAGSKQLAEGTVITLYETRAIPASEATAHLVALGYSADDAALMLEITDLNRELRIVNSAVTRVGTLYINRRITRAGATDSLKGLDLTPDHVAHLLQAWDLERSANVKQLTAAEIVDAWEYAIIDQQEAEAELVTIGYTPYDAWVRLSIKAKQALPDKPPKVLTGPGELP